MAGNSMENEPRTPKATADGLQEGRPHPQLRKYAAHYDKVDYATAMMRLQMRRSGEMPLIKGGVDDGSPEMEVSDSLFDNEGHVVVDPKAGETPQRPSPRPVPPPEPAQARHEEPPRRLPPPVPTREELLRSAPGSVEASVDVSADPFVGHMQTVPRYDPFSGEKFSGEIPEPARDAGLSRLREENADLKRSVDMMKAQLMESRGALKPLQDSLQEYRRSYDELKRTAEGLAAELKAAQGPASYLRGRTRVSVSANGMSFSVSAVSMEESRYGVMAVLPVTQDGMTFTPAPLTDVDLEWGGRAETLSFCTSFDVDGLGIRALVFFRKPGSEPPPPPVRTPPSVPEYDPHDPYGGQSASDLVRKLVAS